MAKSQRKSSARPGESTKGAGQGQADSSGTKETSFGEQADKFSSNPAPWTGGFKALVSLFLIYHLGAMILSPLSLPPSSDLVRQLQRGVAHYQSVLYLNHGYRFFAPNPGPSRLVRYEIEFSDGKKEVGLFPDRKAINRDYPRLMYHRWFMLSESIANLITADARKSEIQRHLERLNTELVEANKGSGNRSATSIEAEISDVEMAWKEEEQRRQKLLSPIANRFLKKYPEAKSVQLWIQVRDLPTIDQVRRRIDPGDPRFLTDAGRFDMGRWFQDGRYQGAIESDSKGRVNDKNSQQMETLPPANK